MAAVIKNTLFRCACCAKPSSDQCGRPRSISAS